MPEKPQKPLPGNDYQRVGVGEFIKITFWVIKLLFKLLPFTTSVYLVSAILMQMQDLLYTYIFAKAIDALISTASTPGSSITMLYPYLLWILGYNVLTTIIGFIRSYSASTIRTISNPRIRQSFYYKLNNLGIQTLEQPDVSDKIHRADDYLMNIVPFLNGTVLLVAHIIKLVSVGIILGSFMPLLAIGILVTSIPYLFIDKWFRQRIYKLMYENTEKRRKAGSSYSNLINSNQLQEVEISGAFKYLDEKYIKFHEWLNGLSLKIQRQGRAGGYSFGLITDVVILWGYVQIFGRLISKAISVGNTTFWMRYLNIFSNAINDSIQGFNDQFETAMQLKDTYALFNLQPSFKEGHVQISRMEKGPEIIFRNADFTYPRTERKIIDNLNLIIKPGEKVAIVGPNGAGKTTIIKLISRLYPVTSGELLINKENINNLNSESLYKNMGVLFQDFNIYPQLTVRENIYIGRSEEEVNETKVRIAAQTADAMNFINEYPNKFDQVLSEKYKGGIRPSTGQWQKIAIARFFYRNAPLVIFDEPTASIDAVSEYNIFNQIWDFFEDKTVIIISHRFSTVRNADRIIVIDNGKIIEEGTHDQLMSLGGKYQQAFLLQAEGYK